MTQSSMSGRIRVAYLVLHCAIHDNDLYHAILYNIELYYMMLQFIYSLVLSDTICDYLVVPRCA